MASGMYLLSIVIAGGRADLSTGNQDNKNHDNPKKEEWPGPPWRKETEQLRIEGMVVADTGRIREKRMLRCLLSLSPNLDLKSK